MPGYYPEKVAKLQRRARGIKAFMAQATVRVHQVLGKATMLREGLLRPKHGIGRPCALPLSPTNSRNYGTGVPIPVRIFEKTFPIAGPNNARTAMTMIAATTINKNRIKALEITAFPQLN